jgi:CDP-diacylglycerol--glycerol-3-phosphate 3-phosphatidyltransferase
MIMDRSYSIRVIIVIVLLIAASTDYLDGYFARRFNKVSELGKIIDPLADKALIGVIVLLLYIKGEISDFFITITLGRDILIFLGGMYVSIKVGKVIPSDMIGKITVTVIGFFLLSVILKLEIYQNATYVILEYLSIALIFISFINYTVRGIKLLRIN